MVSAARGRVGRRGATAKTPADRRRTPRVEGPPPREAWLALPRPRSPPKSRERRPTRAPRRWRPRESLPVEGDASRPAVDALDIDAAARRDRRHLRGFADAAAPPLVPVDVDAPERTQANTSRALDSGSRARSASRRSDRRRTQARTPWSLWFAHSVGLRKPKRAMSLDHLTSARDPQISSDFCRRLQV